MINTGKIRSGKCNAHSNAAAIDRETENALERICVAELLQMVLEDGGRDLQRDFYLAVE